MNVGENKVVSITYLLRENDANGELIQEVNEERPFVYLFGQGGLLPAFKSNLEGLEDGDIFDFKLSKEDAYGAPSDENIIDLPKKIFEVDGKVDESLLKVGETVPMEDQEGMPLVGIIAELGDEVVKMDFNHPLAGMDLHFCGKVLEVREPSPEELEHGHAHGPEGH